MSFGKNRVSLIFFVSLFVLGGLAFALPSVRAALGITSNSPTRNTLLNPASRLKTGANSAPVAMAMTTTTNIVGWLTWANWTTITADQGITGNVGVRTVTAPGTGAITVSDAYGTGQQWAFANGWDNGANTKAWRFNFSTTNYTTLTFSCKMAGTTSFTSFMGPRDFKLQYSLNGTTWTDVSGGTLQAGAATGSAANFQHPE